MKRRRIIIQVALALCVASLVLAQEQSPKTSSTQKHFILHSDEFPNIQSLLDEQAAQGYRVAGVSYHSSIKNLQTRGQIEFSFKLEDASEKYQSRALITELRASALQREINHAGEKGYRLLRQTPIPIELGFIHPQDMFIAIMEKPVNSSGCYQYRVISYRRRAYDQERIEQAQREGFTEVSSLQFGPVTYLVLEKAMN